MTEAQAWRKVAERIDKDPYFRGLCEQAAMVCLSIDDYYDMKNRVRSYLETHVRWAYPACTERQARVLAALWLALEAEEEGT